ncbi:TPA: hypothetical protein KON27_003200 [Clostridioides difficile]|nr:hypothetical protein [Clostridioides difficile]HBF4255181.1 hypothetical protein [Clostridioides difficile]
MNDHEIISVFYKSFRLTIWNVNFATYDGEMITLTGFILTMWYVNKAKDRNDNFKTPNFYINNVEKN